MAYVAVNSNGEEFIFERKPYRDIEDPVWFSIGEYCPLPKGYVEKLIGHTLTWDDEPVELEEVEEVEEKLKENGL